MLYDIAHFIRNNFSVIWVWIEEINSILFKLRYSKGLQNIPAILSSYSTFITNNNEEKHLKLRIAEKGDSQDLAFFFKRQPKSSFNYFTPHAFDVKTLEKLIERDSFISMLVLIDSQIVGYFFLRSFCNGSSFLGKMVDVDYQGKGIGKIICKASMSVALILGVRMYESINRKNHASMRSSSVLRQVIVKELDNDELLIEDFPLEK